MRRLEQTKSPSDGALFVYNVCLLVDPAQASLEKYFCLDCTLSELMVTFTYNIKKETNVIY